MTDERPTKNEADADAYALAEILWDPNEGLDDDETLGPCGCTDYHMSDCPLMTGTHDDYDDFSLADQEYYYGEHE